MRLSNELLLDLVNGAGGDPSGSWDAGAHAAPPASSDRRRTDRRRLAAIGAITRYATIGGTTRDVEFRDVSATGIGLIVRDSVLAPGEQFVVHAPRLRRDEGFTPPTGESDDTLNILCTVRAVRVRLDGRIGVGAEFAAAEERTAADRVIAVRSRLGGSVRMGADPETPPDRGPPWQPDRGKRRLAGEPFKRRAERLPVRALAQMYLCLDDGGDSPVERVEVLDYSASGVRIARREPLHAGDQVVIRIPREDEGPVTRLCCVTRVGADGFLSAFGARFVPFSRRRGRGLLARIADWVA